MGVGGHGIRNMGTLNNDLLMKHVWRIHNVTSSDSLRHVEDIDLVLHKLHLPSLSNKGSLLAPFSDNDIQTLCLTWQMTNL